ncbi:bifunctional riboflavin kinase/FAD synthetase [Nocardioides sambongensis]|uniref:bifunctional riboflavin kinase/FAD synthetase n=1 Tax=Nocardioides sambongensis TaxID=2589074 RepID=UPI00112EC5EA|nr:bifunctional riboflavin kinase/FAD synthetase [Nocardioides sambongensis]
MHIWRSLEEIPTDLGPTAAIIGNFDGVHLGHQHVVETARGLADRDGLRLVAVTFDPHPLAVVRPDLAPVRLTDLDRRARLLQEAGVDDVLVLQFGRELASWSPAQFIERVLVHGLDARVVVVGANFRFGHKAAGDVETLRADGRFAVEGIDLDGAHGDVWSSTYVRERLAAGDVAAATEALGRPHVVSGSVVRGDQRGRDLGYPTANVPTGGVAAPADGVYAGWLRRLDVPGEPALPAAISVGTNPTFAGERERRVEAYVLDRDDLDLYGVPVEISFVSWIRGMHRFEGLDELLAAMADDVRRTRTLLG